MFQDFGQIIKDGGVAVYGLMFLAAFGIAIIYERTKALYFDYGTDSDVFVKQMKTFIVGDKIEDALLYCSNQGKALLPKMVKMILERADRDDDSIKNAHEIASMEVVPLITKRLGYLAMIANVATLVGLLGTIHGLIQSFYAVGGAAPEQKQALLAAGISISMNTTMMGLMVAIPVMVIYSVLQARQNKLIEDMISVSAKIVDVLVSRSYQAYDEHTAYASSETVPVKVASNGTAKRKAV